MSIKRGVSLYSFQNETFLGEMNLEDCLRTCAEIGANGIEVVSEQSFWGILKSLFLKKKWQIGIIS